MPEICKEISDFRDLILADRPKRSPIYRTAAENVCNAQKFIDSASSGASNAVMAALRNHAFKGTLSALPSLIIPCPRCGGRLTATSVKPAMFMADSADLEDIAHGCARCGTELIRTVIAEQSA